MSDESPRSPVRPGQRLEDFVDAVAEDELSSWGLLGYFLLTYQILWVIGYWIYVGTGVAGISATSYFSYLFDGWLATGFGALFLFVPITVAGETIRHWFKGLMASMNRRR